MIPVLVKSSFIHFDEEIDISYRLYENGSYERLIGCQISGYKYFSLHSRNPCELYSGTVTSNYRNIHFIYLLGGTKHEKIIAYGENYIVVKRKNKMFIKGMSGSSKEIKQYMIHSNCGKYSLVLENGKSSLYFTKDHMTKIVPQSHEFSPLYQTDTHYKFFWERNFKPKNGAEVSYILIRGKYYLTACKNGNIYLQWDKAIFDYYPSNIRDRIRYFLYSIYRCNKTYSKNGSKCIPRPVALKILKGIF